MLGPRLLQPVEGDFDVEVQVLPFPRPKPNTGTGKDKHSYVAAGLLVWVDDKTFVRCLRAALGEREDVFGHVEAFLEGKRFLGQYFVNMQTRQIPDKTAYLKIERRRLKELAAYQSVDGKKWKLHARFNFPKLPGTVQVGVGVVNSTSLEFAPEMSGLKITRK